MSSNQIEKAARAAMIAVETARATLREAQEGFENVLAAQDTVAPIDELQNDTAVAIFDPPVAFVDGFSQGHPLLTMRDGAQPLTGGESLYKPPSRVFPVLWRMSDEQGVWFEYDLDSAAAFVREGAKEQPLFAHPLPYVRMEEHERWRIAYSAIQWCRDRGVVSSVDLVTVAVKLAEEAVLQRLQLQQEPEDPR